MLSARVNTNLKQVRKRYNKFFKRFPNIVLQGLERAGVQLKEIILEKTDRGIDIAGRRFTPYSRMYEELKGKKKVDLQDTNRMLQSIGSRVVNKRKVQVYFRNQGMAKRALWHQTGQGNLPERKFFGFNNSTEKVIQRTFAKFVKQKMKALKI
jgi:hypothetical protein